MSDWGAGGCHEVKKGVWGRAHRDDNEGSWGDVVKMGRSQARVGTCLFTHVIPLNLDY